MTDVTFIAKLTPFRDGSEHAANLPGSWFISHGLGTPAAGTFTEVAFDPELEKSPEITVEVRYEIVRQVADQLYGSRWAFTYAPEDYADAIEPYNLVRRERVLVTSAQVW